MPAPQTIGHHEQPQAALAGALVDAAVDGILIDFALCASVGAQANAKHSPVCALALHAHRPLDSDEIVALANSEVLIVRWRLLVTLLDNAHKAWSICRGAALGAKAVGLVGAQCAAVGAAVKVDSTKSARFGRLFELLHDLEALL